MVLRAPAMRSCVGDMNLSGLAGDQLVGDMPDHRRFAMKAKSTTIAAAALSLVTVTLVGLAASTPAMALNPQPLPPGMRFALNPQPLPPGMRAYRTYTPHLQLHRR
jgi:hypothetical protein